MVNTDRGERATRTIASIRSHNKSEESHQDVEVGTKTPETHTHTHTHTHTCKRRWTLSIACSFRTPSCHPRLRTLRIQWPPFDPRWSFAVDGAAVVDALHPGAVLLRLTGFVPGGVILATLAAGAAGIETLLEGVDGIFALDRAAWGVLGDPRAVFGRVEVLVPGVRVGAGLREGGHVVGKRT